MGDVHAYPRVPHTADTLRFLRTLGDATGPVFLSEYGIGSAVDLWRVTRQFEQLGKGRCRRRPVLPGEIGPIPSRLGTLAIGGVFFATPADFFTQSLRKMAGQRTLGLNAIRANPHIIGHNVTGMMDHVNCGEGLFTLFRRAKTGHGGCDVRGVCAPAAVFVRGAGARGAWRPRASGRGVGQRGRAGAGRIRRPSAGGGSGHDPTAGAHRERDDSGAAGGRGAANWRCRSLRTNWSSTDRRAGTVCWRLSNAAERPRGGETEFYVADPAALPAVKAEVVLWGDDPELARWLGEHGVRTRPWAAVSPTTREVILVAGRTGGGGRRRPGASSRGTSPAGPRPYSCLPPSSAKETTPWPGCRCRVRDR